MLFKYLAKSSRTIQCYYNVTARKKVYKNYARMPSKCREMIFYIKIRVKFSTKVRSISRIHVEKLS